MKNSLLRFSLLSLIAFFSACDSEPPTVPRESPEENAVQRKAFHNASMKMLEQGAAVLSENLAQARQLQQAITQFLAQPDSESLTQAQDQWLINHNTLRKFYFYRHIGLNAPDLFANFARLNHRISTYPIQPGFIDTYGPYRYSGIVHDIGFPLSKESLVNQHGLTDVAEAVLGLHAIEFMLYNSGASRATKDFVAQTELNEDHRERGFEKVEELPVNRRRALLALQAELLVEDFETLLSEWQAQTVESFYYRWMESDISELSEVVKNSTANALSTIILELSAIKLATDESDAESDTVSVNLIRAPSGQQHEFINHAIVSIHANLDFFAAAQADEIRLYLQTAIDELNAQKQPGKASPELWKDIYSAIKQANDLALKTDSF